MIDEPENCKLALVRLMIEHWKLLRAFERIVERLPPEHSNRTLSQLKYSAKNFQSLLTNLSVNVVAFEGQRFEANLPVSAVNADEFQGESNLIVEMTIEPAIVDGNTVLSAGKVIVKKGGDGAN